MASGAPRKTPDAFKSACTRFIDIDALIKGAEDEGQDTPGGSGKSAPRKGTVDDDLVALLGTAWKAAKRDEEGFAALSEVGNIAGNRSSFDVRNYGFKRLSELARSLAQFEVKPGDNGQLMIKRLR